jgi:branched-chain amino acid transport system permease protein
VRSGIALALAALAAGGCAPVVEPEQLALCREVLPALHEEGTVIRESRYGPPADGPGVRIDYLAERRGRPRTVHFATCRFDGRDGRGRPTLAALATERGPLSETRFIILKRWWLEQVPAPSLSAAKARSGLAESAGAG